VSVTMAERTQQPSPRAKRGRRPSRRRLALLCGALGLTSACLDPAISDEAPISESMPVLDGFDAGVEAVEDAPEELPAPTTAAPEPPPRDARTRRPRRR